MAYPEPSRVLDAIKNHVAQRPDDTAFVFIRRRTDEGRTMSWSELWQRSATIAQGLPLSSSEAPLGVLLFCRDEAHFVVGLLAVWMRGGVAIPGTGSLNSNILDRNAHILAASQPDVILHDLSANDIDKLRPHRGQAVFRHIDDKEPVAQPSVTKGGGLLQFTSGTTSQPKGILLTDGMIAANCTAIAKAYDLSAKSVGVHWLPLHHDMGLIGGVVSAFWTGGLSVLLRPTLFIQDPLYWMRAISKWRGTITSAPNFAYARLVKATRAEPPEGIDLSCLKNVIIGGEPVQQETTEGLIETLGPFGLSPDALAPSYGLAEATLLASSGKRSGGPAFEPTDLGANVATLGPPVDGLTVEVVNDGRLCTEAELGEITLTGRSVGHVIPFGENWRLRDTHGLAPPVAPGDFGFMKNGSIHITGRSANKIILRGRNIFAEDVERIATKAVPHTTPSGAAAFGIAMDGSEGLCLLLEIPKSQEFGCLAELNAQIGSKLGVKLARLVILHSSSLPRTSSGKVKRGVARDLLTAGSLDKRIRGNVIQTGH